MKRPIKDTEDSARSITRRGLVLGGSMTAFMAVLAARMRSMQVEQADAFRLLAEENRINLRLIPPTRGLIFDRNGQALAENAQNYRIVIVKEDAGEVEAVMARLRALVPISDDDLERALTEIRRRSPFVPVTIADQLRWEDISEVAVNSPALPGVTPEVGLTRVYPKGQDFAHVVGYVGPVSDYDLSRIEDPDPVLQIPKFQIGKLGVEAKIEDDLRGKAGTKRIEVNAAGRVMRELDRQSGQKGNDLQLTIDSALQNFAQARLLAHDNSRSASAVLMDIQTGDLLAVASGPSFDPNKFVRGISVPDYQALQDPELRPLINKAVQGVYPPGSTFKMVTALAAIEAGEATPGETVYCPGHVEVGGRRFHCWKRVGHGWMDMHESLKQSCDVYYYEMAQRAGIERITAMARKLGLGQKFDLPMSAVASGLTPTKDWKRRRHGADWVIGDSLNASIGQGYMLSSPLQLAVMTARLVTGEGIHPRLIKSVNGVETDVKSDGTLGLSPTLLSQVSKAMYDVCNHRRGTAYRSRITAEGKRIAGKTGTSQVRSVIVDKDVPWDERDHGLFVGYAPYDAPKYACAVVVEHGTGGSVAAAPIARDILARAMHDGMPPLSIFPGSTRNEISRMWERMPLREDQDGSGQDRA